MENRNQQALDGLGQRIRSARENVDKSQTQVAVAMGSDKSVLSKIENSICYPRVDTLVRIADEIGVTMGSLLQTEEDGNMGRLMDYLQTKAETIKKLTPQQLASFQGAIENILHIIVTE